MKPCRAAWLLLSLAAADVTAAPRHVVSLNLCTDQLLLEVAAPAQVAGLTTLARDPLLSAHASAALAFPAHRGHSEEVLALQPDLVVADTGASPALLTLLSRLGIPVVVFEPAHDLAGLIDQLERAATLLEQHARAAPLIAALQALVHHVPPATVSAWLLQPGGHAPGDDTLAPALLQAAGLRNLAPGTGYGHGGFPGLEVLIGSQPQLLVLDAAAPASPSLADAYLSHPVLSALPALRRVTVPEAQWTCGGEGFVRAVATLREAALSVP